MTGLSTVRTPVLAYFYWAIFLGFTIGVSLFLYRMIALAASEDDLYGMSTLSSYQEQAAYRKSVRAAEQDIDLD